MHPNAYLRAFWRNETLDQVFVAMSFADRYKDRFEQVFKPAIEDKEIAGLRLKAFRVDNSKTGDSILTEIVENIAHSRLVLADVSAIDEGRYTNVVIRNANVMYEVGVALACRFPSEVLLVRDDGKPFLFDVSSVPHKTIDFKDTAAAVAGIRAAIAERIQEATLIGDARIQIAVRSLTQDELRVLRHYANLKPDEMSDIARPMIAGKPPMLSLPNARGVEGLLLKGCIKAVAVNSNGGSMFYTTTAFGYSLAKAAGTILVPVDPAAREDDLSAQNTTASGDAAAPSS